MIGNVGYPESLTDPSYCGQILVLTYPLIGNYGVPATDHCISDILSSQIESSKIHLSAVIISDYSSQFSHYKAQQSLADWLKNSKVPALYGVDTRSLTKILREGGSTLAKIVFEGPICAPKFSPCRTFIQNMTWLDPNLENLVAKVSTKNNFIVQPNQKDTSIRILALDFGIKFNQLRCFANRGVTVEVCPWNYDFLSRSDYDGLFLSNGPGNPELLAIVISRLKELLIRKSVPIFGICLGHQLLALASGASTIKMKFGNRGQNIPCIDKITNRCYITSQNHGYAVDPSTLPADWTEYFVNANDGSNEGIYHTSLPYFSVQFHPEACPGPKDTEFLFDQFISLILDFRKNGHSSIMTLQKQENPPAVIGPPKKVLLLGSGGLSIGQAGEFDYSGSQAIKALKSDGVYTILINPNIATIQTTQGLADRVYFLPLTPEYVRKVIHREKPDSIFCTFGGQTALNVGVQMRDEFENLGVRVLGTPIRSIEITEDRDLFIKALSEIGEKCAQSKSANTIAEAMDAAKEIGYPVIVRAAYTLGGLGSGFADNPAQMKELCSKAFASSPQVLVEKSMKGWKEIEYEVVRDVFGNCVTVCNMEVK
jgi:carbamoyl-phosphate synthase/aspartate carbamoyltransferase